MKFLLKPALTLALAVSLVYLAATENSANATYRESQLRSHEKQENQFSASGNLTSTLAPSQRTNLEPRPVGVNQIQANPKMPVTSESLWAKLNWNEHAKLLKSMNFNTAESGSNPGSEESFDDKWATFIQDRALAQDTLVRALDVLTVDEAPRERLFVLNLLSMINDGSPAMGAIFRKEMDAVLHSSDVERAISSDAGLSSTQSRDLLFVVAINNYLVTRPSKDEVFSVFSESIHSFKNNPNLKTILVERFKDLYPQEKSRIETMFGSST